MYTLQNITTAPSYDALKRNGFSDLDVIAYYGTPKADRATMLKQIQSNKVQEIKPKKLTRNDTNAKFVSQGTHLCTVASIRRMALELMDKDFTVNGKVYNMNKLGWKFSMNNNKTRFGLCSYRGRRTMFGVEWSAKKLHLSQYLIVESDKSYDKWVNTMLHEIAHAIDVEIRDKSGHDGHWRRIALSIGCDGERCSDADVDPKSGKYTISCPNGHEEVSHKFSRRITQGHISCGKCSKANGTKGFNKDYLLTQTQNY